jgi:hypothetical protein
MVSSGPSAKFLLSICGKQHFSLLQCHFYPFSWQSKLTPTPMSFLPFLVAIKAYPYSNAIFTLSRGNQSLPLLQCHFLLSICGNQTFFLPEANCLHFLLAIKTIPISNVNLIPM